MVIVVTGDTETAPSEHILWTPSHIDYIFIILVENDVKEEGNAALGESADVDAVIAVDLEEYKVPVTGWYDGLVV